MKEITLKIKKVMVLSGIGGTDKISLTLDVPESAFPEMGYETYAEISTRHGYGEEYCRRVLGLEPDEVIRVDGK